MLTKRTVGLGMGVNLLVNKDSGSEEVMFQFCLKVEKPDEEYLISLGFVTEFW